MKNISLYLYTIFRGNLVGKDQDGNGKNSRDPECDNEPR